jgi:hypothetical protein
MSNQRANSRPQHQALTNWIHGDEYKMAHTTQATVTNSHKPILSTQQTSVPMIPAKQRPLNNHREARNENSKEEAYQLEVNKNVATTPNTPKPKAGNRT